MVAKLAASTFIYYFLNVGSTGTFWTDPNRLFNWEQNKVFLQYRGSFENWPFVFVGWDSAWYLSILTRGYTFSPQTFTFMPGLPFFGVLFELVLQNSLLSITVCSLVFGVLWVPLYQLLAEGFLNKKAAFASTLLLAFSPYLFVFTTVAYAEGLLMFFTLLALYLFRKTKVAFASLFAGIAVLTRIMGVVVIFPMLYSSLKSRDKTRTRNIILSILPVVAIPLWLAYCYLTSGDLLATVHTTEWTGLYTVPSFLFHDLPLIGPKAFFEISMQNWPAIQFWFLPLAMFLALSIPPFLIYKVAKIDKPLAIYSLAGYLGFLFFGAIVSTPRFASVLFPLWLPLTAKLTMSKKQAALVASIIGVFYIISLIMWVSFLEGQFIA